MAQPIPMQTFATAKRGAKTCTRQIGLSKDVSGCYVLMEISKPYYVGISRGVVGRLIQHVRGRTHFDASLAYRVASERQRHGMRRQEAMEAPAFLAAFQEAKLFLASLNVAFIEIGCPVELYAFELYCCMELDTCQWNTFRTH
ncbi:MAG TPA: hypothetical protein VG269_21695 [Tepidisphaeraceae bacterium]|nr:hypothetical protein [Tepidisphaeraceae bacterium]